MKGAISRAVLCRSFLLALSGVMLCCYPAGADVLEIAADGVVTVHSRAAAFNGISGSATLSRSEEHSGVPRAAIGSILAQAAERHALPNELLLSIAWRESHLQGAAVSPKGAIGVMQLMPATARALGVDPFDPAQNIEGGATYLRQMLDRYGNSLPLALAAYNAGPSAVDRYRGIPPFSQTKIYVRDILSAGVSSPSPSVLSINP